MMLIRPLDCLNEKNNSTQNSHKKKVLSEVVLSFITGLLDRNIWCDLDSDGYDCM
jgi:hypothetical protein